MARKKTLGSLIVSMFASTTGFEKGINQARRKLGEFAKDVAKIGQGFTQALTGPLAALAISAASIAAPIEKTASEIEGLVGASADQVQAWRRDIAKLAPELGKAPDELTKGLYFVASAGFKGAKAMEVLEASARASAAGMGETTDVANAVTSAISAYGEESLAVGRATDVLVAAVRAGKVEAAELAPALSKVIPIAAEMGLSFDQVGATVAAMTRIGFSASESTTALASTLKNLLKPSTAAEQTLASVGLSSQQLREQLKEKGLLSVLSTLKETFKGNSTEMAKVFTDTEALKTVMSLLGKNADANVEIFDQLANSGGALDHAFAAAEKTFSHQLNKALAAGKVLLMEIGNAILPRLTPWIHKLAAFVSGAAQAFGDLDDESKAYVITAGAVLAAIGPALIAFSKFLLLFKGLLVIAPLAVKAFGAIKVAVMALAGSTGIGLIIVALGLLTTAWYNNWGGIRDFMEKVQKRISEMFGKIKDGLSKVGAAVKAIWNKAWGEAGSAAEESADITKEKVTEVAKTAASAGNAIEKSYTAKIEAAGSATADFAAESQDDLQGLAAKADEALAGIGSNLDSVRDKMAVDQVEAIRFMRDTESTALAQSTLDHQLHAENVAVAADTARQAQEDAARAAAEEQARVLDENERKWTTYADTVTDYVSEGFRGLWETMREGGSVASSVAQGVKKMLVDVLTMLQKHLVAQKLAGIAAATAQAPFTLGASLSQIPGILAAVAPAIAMIQAAKAGISALAHGGVALGGGLVDVGEMGRERIQLPQGAKVYPLSARDRHAGPGGGDRSLYIMLDRRELARGVIPETARMVRIHTGLRR